MKNASRTIAVGLALWAEAVLADAPEVTPYRPTVSNPAALSAPGLLEFEAGVARFRDDAGTRLVSLPYLLQVRLQRKPAYWWGGDAYLRQVTATLGAIASRAWATPWRRRWYELTDSMALGRGRGAFPDRQDRPRGMPRRAGLPR